ncbi:hypothetical protein E3O53_12090 [Cryobacterium sp. TMT2-18-3]|uniref:Exo-alpha-sialidase n=1 Tax=Cryobacterium sandaracinum TaxID=1259247 RepID=A0ABY2JHV9_9MICO|nr:MULTISPECIES: hypothetical protein [Cryobacterium]TFC32021.1 hypothetical protein E3O22_01030 [Cryobacterium sp. TMT2-18-2]TFC62933.1 hypothetical protein E3O53_12090 [Cryobacterium sp. TMT2-18-3]TFD06085.1 hypothetical protein E3T25_03135 [Cryobacterium sandaracinum]
MAANNPSFRKNRNNPARRRWLVGGLAVFLLFDVGLVFFALTATKPDSSAGTVAEAPAVVEPVETNPAEVEPPVVEPVETAATATVAPTRLLAALDSSTAWRASTSACPAASADPELTTDSGATWESFNASIETDASSILAISVTDDTEMSLVTLDIADCAPQLVSTFVAGDQWRAYPERVAAEWYIDPSTPDTVHSPSGDAAAPCATVATLAATDDSSAAILCTDASVFTTTDAGATWSAPASIPGAAALTATADGYGVAVANSAGCVGVALVTVSAAGGLDTTARACLAATVIPGETAVTAAEDGTLWLWAGDAFARSTDGGQSWA